MKKIFLITIAILFTASACDKTPAYRLPDPGGPTSQRQNQQQMPSSGETANWKTYSNSKYGFEVKYPQDYLLQNDGASEPFDMARKNNVVFFKGSSAVMITIEPGVKTLDEYLKSLAELRSKAYEGYPSVEVLKREKTILAEKPLTKDEVNYVAAGLYGIENHINVTPKLVIRIAVRTEKLDDSLHNLNNQVLSTFKLTK